MSITGEHARRHLGEAVADVAHRGAERADDAVLLLEQLHQVELVDGARGRAAGDEPAAALEAEQRAVEGVGADMLEHDVDALLGGELAHHALEPVGAVVDDVVGAERLGLLGLVVVADGGDDGAADRLRHLDRGGADAGAAGMHQDGLARLELGVVEQHVLDGREGDRRAGGVAQRDARRAPESTSRAGMLTRSRAKPSTWKPMMPPTFSQRLSRPSRQALQVPQVSAPYITTGSPGLKPRHAGADRGDLAGRLGADDQRQLALGEGHAAQAPDVDMVERDRLDADLHLAGGRAAAAAARSTQFELAVGDECERAHACPSRRFAGRCTSETFWPPKPNELEIT